MRDVLLSLAVTFSYLVVRSQPGVLPIKKKKRNKKKKTQVTPSFAQGGITSVEQAWTMFFVGQVANSSRYVCTSKDHNCVLIGVSVCY